MITIAKYTTQERESILMHLKNSKYQRVLDIGYSANNWSSQFVTHIIDINPVKTDKICFFGDINSTEVWNQVEKDVKLNGMFDFCIISHVLEDIINPVYVSKMINKFCLAGFIALRSKFIESTRNIENKYRGFIHHRYIFDIQNNKLIGYPKLNFIEYDTRFDLLEKQYTEYNCELQIYWLAQFELSIINDNYMGPDLISVLQYYENLFL